MIKINGGTLESQSARLREKSLDRQLENRVVEGTGISPWEAKVLVDEVKDVYFSGLEGRPPNSGQIRYSCVSSDECAGKPVKECRMVSALLTLIDKDDRPGVSEAGHVDGLRSLRQKKIMRMTEEARDQGGLLSQEDLAQLLSCDVRTVRRDVRELRRKDIVVATRGTVKDIGPGVTHRELALRHWFEGKERVDIARAISHSLCAVERYVQDFSRTVFLCRKGFKKLQIALALGKSCACVDICLGIYEKYRRRPEFKARFDEIDIIGSCHYEAEDEKKRDLRKAGI